MTRWVVVRVVRVDERAGPPRVCDPRPPHETFALLGRDPAEPDWASLCCDLGAARWSAIPGTYDPERRLFAGALAPNRPVRFRVLEELPEMPLEALAGEFLRGERAG